MRSFGETVQRVREQAGMTQADLARKAKIDVGTVSRIEREEQRPSARVRRVLTRVLGIAGITS